MGPAFVLPAIAASEARGSTAYDAQPEAKAAGLPGDERSHAVLMRAAAGKGGLSGPTIALLEGRHRGGGNTLRAAVLGANDGLVSNLSLVMGVAGAAAADNTLLLTGLAGLVAGACSMAMGEWLSVTSSRELYQSQIATEAEELREVPEEEEEELVLIYQAKGIAEPQRARWRSGCWAMKEPRSTRWRARSSGSIRISSAGPPGRPRHGRSCSLRPARSSRSRRSCCSRGDRR